ncbi:hypothetical protein CUMW_135140 [Citrus unshiu]|nr:hypothetical protein CUMW_135140 [Citrus unshiu]
MEADEIVNIQYKDYNAIGDFQLFRSIASIFTKDEFVDVEFAEAIVVQKGIQFAKDIGLGRAIIESDSFNVVKIIILCNLRLQTNVQMSNLDSESPRNFYVFTTWDKCKVKM